MPQYTTKESCVGAGECIGAGGVNPRFMTNFSTREKCAANGTAVLCCPLKFCAQRTLIVLIAHAIAGVCGPLPYGQYGSWDFIESASWNEIDDWRPNMTTEDICIPEPCFDRIDAAKCSATISQGIFTCEADFCSD
eukprot:SAG31_NODE_18962_length_616_cov_1.307544_1_plen_135_part_10